MITANFATQEEFETVFFDQELYDRHSQDTDPDMGTIRAGNMESAFKSSTFLSSYVDGELAGYLQIESNGHLHVSVLKDYRNRGKEIVDACLELWPFNFFVAIPECFPSVYHFAKNYGCKEKEIRKDAWMKNGKAHDVHILTYEVD